MSKAPTIVLIPETREDGKPEPLYGMLNRLISKDFPELAENRLLLAWKTSWKPDRDGKIVLGKAHKATEIERELHPDPYCGVILLHSIIVPEMTREQQEALLHHETNHFGITQDEEGEINRDDRGRPILRLRKHDVEDFESTVRKYGLYHKGLQEFARAILENKAAAEKNGESEEEAT